MTSKSTKKDYKALYNALKNEHKFVLKQSSNALSDALNRLKAKDAELAAKDEELAKYKIQKDEDDRLKAKCGWTFQETHSLLCLYIEKSTGKVDNGLRQCELEDRHACWREEWKTEDYTINDILDHYKSVCEELSSTYNKLKKYEEAEQDYNLKFGLEETRLTSQEMKEMERRAREDEDEDDDRPLVPKKKSKPKK